MIRDISLSFELRLLCLFLEWILVIGYRLFVSTFADEGNIRRPIWNLSFARETGICAALKLLNWGYSLFMQVDWLDFYWWVVYCVKPFPISHLFLMWELYRFEVISLWLQARSGKCFLKVIGVISYLISPDASRSDLNNRFGKTWNEIIFMSLFIH